VNTLLRDTFRNLDKVKSANVSAKLAADGGGESFTASLGGPFESQGKNKLPKVQLDAKLEGGGQSFTAGVTWLGDKGYVNLQGTNYEVSGLVAKQFQAGYEEAAKQQKTADPDEALILGIDFSKWLKNGRNEGEAKVGDTDTIKLTGDADVAQVITDVQRMAEKARTLNLPGIQDAQTKLTPAQRQEIVDGVKKFAIEVYTGKEDRILRRLVVNAVVQPQGEQPSNVVFDLTLNDVGSDQDFSAPKNAKPFSELVDAAKELTSGVLGSGSSGGASGSANLDKYAKCIDAAQGDTSKMQKCADLIDG
jgi:hypothetical protein